MDGKEMYTTEKIRERERESTKKEGENTFYRFELSAPAGSSTNDLQIKRKQTKISTSTQILRVQLYTVQQQHTHKNGN